MGEMESSVHTSGKSSADLFGVAEENRLVYIEPEIVDGGLRIPPELEDEGIARWQHCLVGKFLSTSPHIRQVQSWANRLWGKKGSVRVSWLGDRLLLFQFPTAETAHWVFSCSPWHLRSDMCYLRKWEPRIRAEEPRTMIPIWVRFLYLPLEHVTRRILTRLASKLGRPLWFDKSSRLGRRLGYPRVCVEMGVDSEFPDFLQLVPDRRPAYTISIEYCNKPEMCEKCSRFGHNCEKEVQESLDT
ncbi:unnamed protein product [Linum trigynum]|uniref:DUF4283 domain-containing protein n=1 Tax=Linum trigynum TaxID=586398 RepID=A0AAV2CWI6_9ROSI